MPLHSSATKQVRNKTQNNGRFGGNFGLYRNDGLAVVDILPGPDMERRVKQLRKVFKTLAFMLPLKPICLLQTS